MKLAIIDLDGVVANVDARFAQAKADAEAAFVNRAYEKREYDNVYWRAVFTPSYASMDVLLNEGVNDALLDIQVVGYKAVFLSSRPLTMRDATARWLFEHTVYDMDDDLVMKATAFQYVKTVVWKAGMVQTLAAMHHASHVLVVDDEQANLDEVARVGVIPPVLPGLMIAHSLVEAVAKLEGTWVEPDPFLPEGY